MRLPREYDLICLSHLRWDFVFQRPQHLLTRCARSRRVLFFEEPTFDEGVARLDLIKHPDGVEVAVPRLPIGSTEAEVNALLRHLLESHMAERSRHYVLWYYTPMMLSFTEHLRPLCTVYDCMDELANFRGAPPRLRQLEAELLRRADLVFTGGRSLYEAKRDQHRSVHCFPSSVDVEHFAQARAGGADPLDQLAIPSPRLGFFGVIDERMDLALLEAVARARPEWQLVMLGPVVKIDPESLPRLPNIHWLGGKPYKELPRYIAGWDVALLPFARNEATRFISPTKTPEYLAAGRPVVSTSITDVVRPYGEAGLAAIADTPEEFVAAVERVLAEDGAARQERADELLAKMSWDRSWSAMQELIDTAIAQRTQPQREAEPRSAVRTRAAEGAPSQVALGAGVP